MKSIWKAGDSRSIRLTDKISYRAYELLNKSDLLVKWNRNRFLTRAINNQAILEDGTKSEKLALIVKYNLTDLLLSQSSLDDNLVEESGKDLDGPKEIDEMNEANSKRKKAVDVSTLLSGIPKVK